MNTDKTYIQSMVAGTITAIIFGLSFMFSKRALAIVSPFTLLAYRFTTAFIILSVLRGLRVFKTNYKNKPVGNLFLLGLFQPIVYFLCETYGLSYASASTAGIIIALIPIIVLLLGMIFLKEMPTFLQTVYILLSVVGVIFIVLMEGNGNNKETLVGIMLLMGAAFSAAIFNILSRKISGHFTSFERTYAMMGLGAIAFILLALIQSRHDLYKGLITPFFEGEFIVAVLYLGVLSSVIAFLLINFTLTNIEASKSATFANLTTIVSVIAGVVILGDRFNWYHYIGGIMILFGVWGVNRRRRVIKSFEQSMPKG